MPVESTSRRSDQPQPIGIYTKTAQRSPVVEWILRARIRHPQLNDAIFVGRDSIQVKQVLEDGHLRHVASKTDFDAVILTAATISIPPPADREPDFLKTETDDHALDPREWLVLTLDSSELVFVCLPKHEDAQLQFVQKSYALPVFDEPVLRLGRFLAVDTTGRAIAVAASDGEIVLCTVRPPTHARNDSRSRCDEWGPEIVQRSFQIEGRIQHMDFLIPLAFDPDHVVLLLIVMLRKRAKAIRIEWRLSNGFHPTIFPALDLGLSREIPQLLVPTKDASFFLTVGEQISLFTIILTGSLRQEVVCDLPEVPPAFPGSSKQSPVYTAWTRPERSPTMRREKDIVWLIREDGFILSLEVRGNTFLVIGDNVGTLDFHAGKAFASLSLPSADVLAVAGNMDDGQLLSIGSLPRPYRQEQSRQQTMAPDLLEILPNWTSATDMIGAHVVFPRRHSALNENSVFLTSGKQPSGSITELRTGIQGHLSIEAAIPNLRAVTDIWALPDTDGKILVLLSRPYGTQLMRWDGSEELEEPDGQSFLDLNNRTLAAGVFPGRRLVQVTECGIRIGESLMANFEDTNVKNIDQEGSIVATCLVPDRLAVITVERSNDSCSVHQYDVPELDGNAFLTCSATLHVEDQILCVSATAVDSGTLVLAVTDNAYMILVVFSHRGELLSQAKEPMALPGSGEVLCSQIVLLNALVESQCTKDGGAIAVAGLRNGDISIFTIDVIGGIRIQSQQTFDFGHTSVKLTHLHDAPFSVCAMSDQRIGLLQWDKSTSRMSIENLWITNVLEPDYAQGPSLACAQVPSAEYLRSHETAGSLIIPSADTLQFVSPTGTPSAVPRKTSVSGTPHRLIYVEGLKYFVCASMVTTTPTLPSARPHSRPEEKLQLTPVIDFRASTTGKAAICHRMQPGERVNALTVCSIPRIAGKTSTLIIVGGSFVTPEGKTKGRITYLHPHKGGTAEIIGISEIKAKTFRNPVFALAPLDATTYVACVGDEIHVYRLVVDGDGKSWDAICEPMVLASKARHITIDEDSRSEQRLMTITTAGDSVVTLELRETTTAEGLAKPFKLVSVTEGPRADEGLSHIVLPAVSIPSLDRRYSDGLTILTNSYAQIIGLTRPTDGTQPELKFEAQLLNPLVKVIALPNHNGPKGIISPKMTGCTHSGALTSIALIEESLRRRLFWLQRLIEWSTELSPHSHKQPSYRLVTATGSGHKDRAVSVGFSTAHLPDGQEHGTIKVLNTSMTKLNDMHIDGDVLARILQPGGSHAVKSVLRRIGGCRGEDNDAVGEYVKAHLESELEAVDEMVMVVRELNEWL